MHPLSLAAYGGDCLNGIMADQELRTQEDQCGDCNNGFFLDLDAKICIGASIQNLCRIAYAVPDLFSRCLQATKETALTESFSRKRIARMKITAATVPLAFPCPMEIANVRLHLAAHNPTHKSAHAHAVSQHTNGTRTKMRTCVYTCSCRFFFFLLQLTAGRASTEI